MFRGVRVLVVEDHPEARRLFRRMIAAMTFDVEVCGSLSEGIERVEWADILIIDLRLPNGTGDVLLQRWTELHKGPALVISGYVDKNKEHDLLASRAWNVLQKPFDPDVLRSILQRYGEHIVSHKAYIELRTKVKDLQVQVDKARRLAWTLAIIAAAAGAGAQPLLSLLAGG